MEKKSLKVVAAGMAVAFLGSQVMAQFGEIALTGTVAQTTSFTIVGGAQDPDDNAGTTELTKTLTNLYAPAQTAVNDEQIAQIVVTSNDPDGFTIQVDTANTFSLNDGSGNNIAYTMDVDETSGTLGASTSTTRTGINTDTTISYNQSITGVTSHTWDLDINFNADNYTAATYTDTVTVTVAGI